MQITIQHPDDIQEHLEAVFKLAKGCKLWLFTGHIGAGKTTIIQRICDYLKIEDEVTSPSYSLVNEYKGAAPLFHIDLYRLTDIEEALSIGVEEYLYSGHYCLIEWPGLIAPLLEEMPVLNIQIEIQEDSSRKILFLMEDSFTKSLS